MMAGTIRLFEKIGGLLVEVAPEKAEAAREGRSVSRMVAEIDVLWTAEEEAAREAEAVVAAAEAGRRAEEEAANAKRRAAALAKLEKLGLTREDLDALR